MKVTVNVTQEDIKSGWPLSPTCCPIALALNRAVPDKRWHVTPSAIISTDARLGFRPTPEIAGFIREFDRTGRPSATTYFGPGPFAFELEVAGAA